ncbi:hypothetical protein niasHT_031675 [Heterodera trifolii]|uniref:PPPDE domain-containing protein n=1 Tax=Heterodera trifolii TaxID=157864 RepID=A0ABD2J3U5_9BILA
MGSSSSSDARSSSPGSSKLFCSEAFCACPRSHLRAIEFKKVVVAVDSIFTYPHVAVKVLYKCIDCDHEVRVTYDLVYNRGLGRGEKRKRCGHYKVSNSSFRTGRTFGRNTFYEDIERIFDRMSDYYNLMFRNCYHWANEFNVYLVFI